MLKNRNGREFLMLFAMVLAVCIGCSQSKDEKPDPKRKPDNPLPKPVYSASKFFQSQSGRSQIPGQSSLQEICERHAKQANVEPGFGDLRSIARSSNAKIGEEVANRTLRMTLKKATPEGVDKLMRSLRAEIKKLVQPEEMTIDDEAEQVAAGHVEGFHVIYRTGQGTKGRVKATVEKGKQLDAGPPETQIVSGDPERYLLTVVHTEWVE